MQKLKEYMLIFEANKIKKGGDCFEVHARWMISDRSNRVLVHGLVTSQTVEKIRYRHAWLEDDDFVYDLSNSREITLPKKIYYHFGKIKESELVKYDQNAVLKMITKEGHWGPWDKKFKSYP